MAQLIKVRGIWMNADNILTIESNPYEGTYITFRGNDDEDTYRCHFEGTEEALAIDVQKAINTKADITSAKAKKQERADKAKKITNLIKMEF